jgi:cation diffusion facilitator family transporter
MRSQSHSDSGSGSNKTVMAALVANGAIAVTKLAAAAISGSSAMLAEGIHSIIDTGNEGCLLLGMRRARKPADELHPFGYGAEIYFWSFIVAVLMFGLGSGLSIWEGVRALLHGEAEITDVPWIPYVVLLLAFCFEGYSWTVAARAFQKSRRGFGVWSDIRSMKDPAIFVVLCEDTAALIGIMLAAAGLTLSWLLGDTVWDATASILIGVLLGVTALFLADEVRGLLIGEGADPELAEWVREIMRRNDEIKAVNEIRTIHFGPDDVLLTLSVDFEDDVPSQRIEAIVTASEAEIRGRFPRVRRVFLEVQSVTGHRQMASEEPEPVG